MMANKEKDQLLTFEDKQHIVELLQQTREKFRRAFLAMAESTSEKTQRRFVAMSVSLMELVTGKNAST